MALFGKKNSNKAELSREEIESLKQQLKKKMEEYRNIYSKLVELGGAELPEDILDQVAGGIFPVVPTTPPATISQNSGGNNAPDR